MNETETRTQKCVAFWGIFSEV